MKRLHSLIAATALLSFAHPQARADTEISVDFFHDALAEYGDWREVGDYGYCWQPRDRDPDWRPYADGHWLYTDAGWTWDSEEPFAWAVYHYGRWARLESIGWVWVPGTEWGPAWVSWRRSPQHIGWAPLPPEAEFSHTVGFTTRVDADYDIGPTNYNFVDVRSFGAPRLRAVIIEPRENITIIRETTNITNIRYTNNFIINDGPRYDVISRESSQPIRRLRLDRRVEFSGDARSLRPEQLRASVEGDSFRVLAIPVDKRPATAPKKIAAKVEAAKVDHGWKNAGPAAEVEKLRTKIKSEPAAAPTAPPPKIDKRVVVPGESPVPEPVPKETPPKEKRKDGVRPTNPDARPIPEGTPPPPVKPVPPDRHPGNPNKLPKPEKPEPPAPPTAVDPAPPIPPKKGDAKEPMKPSVPADGPPTEKPRGRKPRVDVPEPARKLPPEAVEPTPDKPLREKPVREKPAPEKDEAKPKSEKPAPHNAEHPTPPEPRGQPGKQARPQPGTPPAAPGDQPGAAPDKGKGKHKGDKKDDGKPDETGR